LINGDIKNLQTDILVIGGGLAGLLAAIEARETGLNVSIVLKGTIEATGSTSIAGGIFCAALGLNNSDDNSLFHLEDTLKSGCYVNNYKLVNLLTENASSAITYLSSFEDIFNKKDKYLYQLPIPGHSFPRGLSGRGGNTNIVRRAIIKKALEVGVNVIEGCMVIDLLKCDNQIKGALAFSSSCKKTLVFEAKAVILASGGAGQLFSSTTNLGEMTGDGYAMALRSGISLTDMEFIQFTPTALASPASLKGKAAPGLLLAQPEARLLNNNYERFMEKYDSENLEASTRDVVARAIYQEIVKGCGTPNGGVYLDLAQVSHEVVETTAHFVNILNEHGIDIRNDLIEIAPFVHFFMGGIVIGSDCSTELEGLYACGEVAGGVHGANRLVGNALTEAAVFGRIAGISAASYVRNYNSRHYDYKEEAKLFQDKLIDLTRRKNNNITINSIIKDVKSIMFQMAGLEKNKEGMTKGLRELNEIKSKLLNVACSNYSEIIYFFEARNLVYTGEAVLLSSLQRKESRGAHYRTDYPKEDRIWERNIYVKINDNDDLVVH